VEFEVDYQYEEYRRIVMAWIRAEGRSPGPVWRVLIGLMSRAVFAYKRRKVGTCRFRIDAAGIVRHCRVGELRVPWSEVKSLRRFSDFYIVDLQRGAMPLPGRVLDAAQREALEAFAAEKLREVPP
jgi:hypothetical protein